MVKPFSAPFADVNDFDLAQKVAEIARSWSLSG
jgi:hypothetical protein